MFPLQPANIDGGAYLPHPTARCNCNVQVHCAVVICAPFVVPRVPEVTEEAKMPVSNGMPADQLLVTWRKSRKSNPSGNCVEVAALPDGDIAVRNSRHPSGPALVYTRAEISAFLAGVKGGEFDDLT
jgi:hypothetical protein